MRETPSPEPNHPLAEKPKKQEIDIIPQTVVERDIKNMVTAAKEAGEPVKPFVFRSLSDLLGRIFKGKEKETLVLLTGLENLEYLTEAELVSVTAEAVYKFSKNSFTPRELEANIRKYVVDHKEHVLNEMLHFEVYEDRLYLHVFPVTTFSAGEKIKYLREGLKLLAAQIKTDQRFKGVKTINGVSWIVAQNPHLLEKLGFTHDGEISKEEYERDFAYETRRVDKSHIEVKKFLELYSY